MARSASARSLIASKIYESLLEYEGAGEAEVHAAAAVLEPNYRKLAAWAPLVELIDLRTLKPLDTETIIGSVKKTGRLLVHLVNYSGNQDRAWHDPLPIRDIELAHRTVSTCHLANIAIKLGRKLKWDPAREEFIGDSSANAMLTRPMRAVSSSTPTRTASSTRRRCRSASPTCSMTACDSTMSNEASGKGSA